MYSFKKLKELIVNMVHNTKNDGVNFGYVINVRNKNYILLYSNRIHDEFFNDFFRKNKKYKNVQRIVENKIMDYVAMKAFNVKLHEETISENIVKVEMKNVLSRIKNKKYTCFFSINGLKYDKQFSFDCGNLILITRKNLIEKYLVAAKVKKDEFKQNELLIRLVSFAYNYDDAAALSKNVANILAFFFNISGLVEMNINPMVSIGYSNHWFNDFVVYRDEGNFSIRNSSSWKNMPFDIQYLDKNCFKVVNKILSKMLQKEKLTSFDETIILVIKLIGSAIISEDRSYSYFKCVTALECFFENAKDTGSIKKKILCKTNALLSMQDDYKKYALFKNFYRIRSLVAHGENAYISNQELYKIEKVASIILMIMLKNYNKFNVDNYRDKIYAYIKKHSESNLKHENNTPNLK